MQGCKDVCRDILKRQYLSSVVWSIAIKFKLSTFSVSEDLKIGNGFLIGGSYPDFFFLLSRMQFFNV